MIVRSRASLVTLALGSVLVLGSIGCDGQSATPSGGEQGGEPSSDVAASGGTADRHASAGAESPMASRVRASQIRFGFKGARGYTGEATREEALAKAEQTLSDLRSGADFSGLAHERSDDPSREHGGDLGPFGRDEIHPKLADAAFKLKVGEVSDIIETEWGFHILRRTR